MKKNLKNKIFYFILGALLFSSITVFAYSLSSKDIGYTPKDSEWQVENVEEAINQLYEKSNVYTYQEYLNGVTSYYTIYNPSDLSVNDPAIKATDKITIPAGGTQFGPYVSLKSGCYHVMVVGTNLDHEGLAYTSTYDTGVNKFNLLNFHKSENVASYDILVDSDVSKAEFLVRSKTSSTKTSTVSNILLFKSSDCY